MSEYYVAVDIGCIECGEGTAVLGIFSDRKTAEVVAKDHAKRQGVDWHGQHHMAVFGPLEVNETNRVEYGSS